MAKVIKECRVCGKSYEACITPNFDCTFRWRDVSCSPECGAEYLRRIEISRGLQTCEEKAIEQPTEAKKRRNKKIDKGADEVVVKEDWLRPEIETE